METQIKAYRKYLADTVKELSNKRKFGKNKDFWEGKYKQAIEAQVKFDLTFPDIVIFDKR